MVQKEIPHQKDVSHLYLEETYKIKVEIINFHPEFCHPTGTNKFSVLYQMQFSVLLIIEVNDVRGRQTT